MNLITNVRVHTSTIDEWFGVDVGFEWTDAGRTRYLTSVQSSYGDAAQRLVTDVATEAMALPVWAEYYKKPRRVEVASSGSDGTPRRVTIPRFRADDFTDWTFSPDGGYIYATTRD